MSVQAIYDTQTASVVSGAVRDICGFAILLRSVTYRDKGFKIDVGCYSFSLHNVCLWPRWLLSAVSLTYFNRGRINAAQVFMTAQIPQGHI